MFKCYEYLMFVVIKKSESNNMINKKKKNDQIKITSKEQTQCK